MGKKIINQVQVKISKKNNNSNSTHEKKQQLNSLMKVLRPKVYITDSSSFKSLVQQLTGNGISSEVPQFLPSPPSFSSSIEKVPIIDVEDDHGGNPESSMETSFDASVDESFQVYSNHYLALTEDYQITGVSEFLSSPPFSSSSSSSPQIVEKVPVVIDVEDDHGGNNPESSMETSFDASVEESFQVCSNNYLGFTEDYQINQAYDYDPFTFEDSNLTEKDYLLMNIINQQQVESSLVYKDFESLLFDHVVDEQISYLSLNFYPQIHPEVSIYDYEISGMMI